MAMRFVYHLTKDGAFIGPGSMFVFSSGLMLVAAGFAYALPDEKVDSRQRYAQNDEAGESESVIFQDSTAPLLNNASLQSGSSPDSYGGTKML